MWGVGGGRFCALPRFGVSAPLRAGLRAVSQDANVTSDLTISTDPAEVGLDASRLQRLDRRIAEWVDSGQLPGFLVTVARHGKLVHVGKGGLRDVENGLHMAQCKAERNRRRSHEVGSRRDVR